MQYGNSDGKVGFFRSIEDNEYLKTQCWRNYQINKITYEDCGGYPIGEGLALEGLTLYDPYDEEKKQSFTCSVNSYEVCDAWK